MNKMQHKQYRRAAGPAWKNQAAAELWLKCRQLADHEAVVRRKGEVSLLWRPYWGRCHGSALVALCDFARAVGATLQAARGDDGPVFLLTRPAARR